MKEIIAICIDFKTLNPQKKWHRYFIDLQLINYNQLVHQNPSKYHMEFIEHANEKMMSDDYELLYCCQNPRSLQDSDSVMDDQEYSNPQDLSQKKCHDSSHSESTSEDQNSSSSNDEMSLSDKQPQLNNSASSTSTIESERNYGSKLVNLPKKTKRISKMSKESEAESSSESDEDDYENSRKPNRATRRKAKADKKSGYPTKNFLPNFKGPHLDYLIEKLGEDVKNHWLVAQIIKKNGINMKDYENLYSIAEFRPIFGQFFAEKQLYRDLMVSRSSREAKIIHLRKLYVFEEAYQTMSFTRIN